MKKMPSVLPKCVQFTCLKAHALIVVVCLLPQSLTQTYLYKQVKMTAESAQRWIQGGDGSGVQESAPSHFFSQTTPDPRPFIVQGRAPLFSKDNDLGPVA